MEIKLENRERIIALLKNGICPVCGRSGLKIPLIHVTRSHGIDRLEFKNMILLGQRNGFMDTEHRERKVEHCKKVNTVKRMKKRGTMRKPNGKAISRANKQHYKNGRISLVKGNPNKQSIIDAQSKPIIRISANGDTLEYLSIKDAGKANGVTLAAISNCLRGKTKSSAGYKWEYGICRKKE
jgi:hypothetical protein